MGIPSDPAHNAVVNIPIQQGAVQAHFASFPGHEQPFEGVNYFSAPDDQSSSGINRASGKAAHPGHKPNADSCLELSTMSNVAANVDGHRGLVRGTDSSFELSSLCDNSPARTDGSSNPESKRLLVGIAAYNEEASELRKTLCNLAMQEMSSELELEALVLLDGWLLTAPSMKAYLNELLHIDDYIPDPEMCNTIMTEGDKESVIPLMQSKVDDVVKEAHAMNSSTTIVIRPADASAKCQVDSDGSRLRVTFVIKSNNLRKTNSHEWMLRAFAQEVPSQFVYLTDVGTTGRGKDFMQKLVNFLNERPHYDGVTGHQMVHMHKPPAGATMFEKLLHAACAYELNMNTDMVEAGASIAGMTVVMHGPSQLIRTSQARQGSPFLNAYFSLMNDSHLTTQQLLKANMQLLEDRVFTHLLMVHSDNPFVGIAHFATFDYEPEIKPVQFLNQRRRWMNGGFAIALYMMQPAIFSELWTKHGLCAALRIAFVYFLFASVILLQHIMLGLVSVMMLTSVGYGDAEKAGLPLTFLGEDEYQHLFCRLSAAAVGLMWMALTVFAVVHHKHKFVSGVFWPTYAIVTTVSLLSSCFWIFSLVLRVNSEPTGFGCYMLAGQVSMLFFPAVVMLLVKRDLEAFVYYLVGPFIYTISIGAYILVPWYSTARTWDLTWGNRPEDTDNKEAKHRQAMMEKLKWQSTAFLVSIYLANALIITLSYVYGISATLGVFALFVTLVMLLHAFAILVYIYEDIMGCWRFRNRAEPRSI